MAIVAIVPASVIAGDARHSLDPSDYIVDLGAYDRREAAARKALHRAAQTLQCVAAERAAAIERAAARDLATSRPADTWACTVSPPTER